MYKIIWSCVLHILKQAHLISAMCMLGRFGGATFLTLQIHD